MASKYWIKLYHEILDDPKMGVLSDRLFRRTIEVFLLAGAEDEEGFLPSLNDMAWHLRQDPEMLETDLVELSKCGIISNVDGRWFVTKFAKRQAPVSDAERMRRYRERKQLQQYYEPVTRSVTKRNVDTDTDIDTEKENANEPIAGKKENLRTAQNAVRGDLEKFFCQRTGLPIPKTNTAKQERSAGQLWWAPLREIADLVEWDTGKARELIKSTVDHMRRNKLTIANPNSILKTAMAIHAERKNGGSSILSQLKSEGYDIGGENA